MRTRINRSGFESIMRFQCKDFDAFKSLMYSEIQKSMAMSNGSIFGPVKESVLSDVEGLIENEKKEFSLTVKKERGNNFQRNK